MFLLYELFLGLSRGEETFCISCISNYAKDKSQGQFCDAPGVLLWIGLWTRLKSMTRNPIFRLPHVACQDECSNRAK